MIEELQELLIHAALDLDAKCLAKSTPAKLHLERHEQVVRLVLFQREVCVARHSEEVSSTDRHAREELAEVSDDEVFEQNPLALARLEKAWQRVGYLHASVALVVRRLVAHRHGDVERQVGDHREGMSRVDGEGRQHRINVLVEVAREIRFGLDGELVVTHDLDAAARERRQDGIEHQAVLAFNELEHALANRFELLTRSNAVDRGRLDAGRHLVLKTHDANLEELIDHVGEDRHEFAALEYGQQLVFAQVQEACAEFEA